MLTLEAARCEVRDQRQMCVCSLVAHIAIANEDTISSSPLGEAIQSNPNARLLVCHSSQPNDCRTVHGLLRAGMAEQRSFPSASTVASVWQAKAMRDVHALVRAFELHSKALQTQARKKRTNVSSAGKA
jgi:hypothetical protein